MIIDDRLIDAVTRQAEESPRLRMNYNLHDSLDAKAQRLINVLLPGTEIPIHRHRHTAETYVILRGRMSIVFYDDEGKEKQIFNLDPQKGNYGLQIPKGEWHAVRIIEPSAILEVKDGPYTPIEPVDILS